MPPITIPPNMDETPYKLLEVNVISAHDLPCTAKTLRTYVSARVNDDHNQKTPLDHKGHINPSWNHKMVFRVDEKFMRSRSSAITFEIYNVAWLRDLPIGTTRLPIQNVLNNNSAMKPMALPISRPSGLLKGTINVTINIVDKDVDSEAKQKVKDKSCQSLEEIIAQKFEPSKDLENVQDFKLMLNEKDSKVVKKTRRKRCSSKSTESGTLRPLPSDIVAALNETSRVNSPEHQSFARSATFDNNWMAGVDDESTKEQTKMNSFDWDESDDGKHKKKRPHHQHHNRRHSDGGGLLLCFIKGFEFTFACGGSSRVKKNKAEMVAGG
nr:PREDICTED: uncharacterized protein LOC108207660 [Daucus carota subsp. sativus]